MPFKFERLEVWQLALEHIDLIYRVSDQLPRSEEYNLKSQMVRAATSVALNIAEGSTGQTDSEQARFLGMAMRSVLETVACLHIIRRRGFVQDATSLDLAYQHADLLVAKLQSMRRSIAPDQSWIREESTAYAAEVV
jgi:four helix bundle protein